MYIKISIQKYEIRNELLSSATMLLSRKIRKTFIGPLGKQYFEV